jgi:thiamine transport system ATP-binding protein
MTEFLQWQGISKRYGGAGGGARAGELALNDFSLGLDEGEVLAILGPSGSGKSTLLRITAGLEPADSGAVLLRGSDLAGVPPNRRGFGLQFQDYCLFPHLDVARNVGFGLRMAGVDRGQARERVRRMLDLVRLEGFEGRDVLTLSGGEQQRVALARSLAPSPRLLMLDEPLGALDAALKADLLPQLSSILRDVGVTVVYVTHDNEEAMAVADRIAVLDAGRLAQAGTPDQLFESPSSPFVASFLGLGALIAGLAGPGILLVRPAAIRFMPVEGGIKVGARVVTRRPGVEGTVVRLLLAGPAGADRSVWCALPRAAVDDPRFRPGAGTIDVWVDLTACLRFG